MSLSGLMKVLLCGLMQCVALSCCDVLLSGLMQGVALWVDAMCCLVG